MASRARPGAVPSGSGRWRDTIERCNVRASPIVLRAQVHDGDGESAKHRCLGLECHHRRVSDRERRGGPRIAVVVSTRDRPERLERSLAALSASIAPGDEVVVVDSASADDRTRRVAEGLGLRAVRCERPGLSRARNAGVAVCDAPIIAFTDDDCIVDASWIEHVRAVLAEDPALGFVTGRVLAAEAGRVQLSTLDRGEPRRFEQGANPFGFGHGANMAMRRSALDAAGPFDEELGAGAPLRAGEDKDMFWRILRAGWVGAYVPELVVTHDQWRRGREAYRVRYGYGVGAGACVVKILRADPRQGLRIAFDQVWDNGIKGVLRAARARDGAAVVGHTIRLLGLFVGAGRSALRRLDRGRFATVRWTERRTRWPS